MCLSPNDAYWPAWSTSLGQCYNHWANVIMTGPMPVNLKPIHTQISQVVSRVIGIEPNGCPGYTPKRRDLYGSAEVRLG